MKIAVATALGLRDTECIFVSGEYAVTAAIGWASIETAQGIDWDRGVRGRRYMVTHIETGLAVPGGPFSEEQARCMAVNMERYGALFDASGLPRSDARSCHAEALEAAIAGRFT